MRRILLETSYIDKQAECAARRITTALGLEPSLDVTTAALGAVGELRLRIRDLQRKNIELEFLSENPDFDFDEQLELDKDLIDHHFQKSHTMPSLYNRFGYEYFIEHYHPDYIIKLCKLLCTRCRENNKEVSEVWTFLLSSLGFISKDFTEHFGPKESDKGVI